MSVNERDEDDKNVIKPSHRLLELCQRRVFHVHRCTQAVVNQQVYVTFPQDHSILLSENIGPMLLGGDAVQRRYPVL